MNLRDSLQAVYEEHGRLTPALLVEVARPKSHPLHAQVFDKAPREAAEAYYRERAHDLIRSVKVVYKEATEHAGEERIRAFHAVPAGDGEYVYKPAGEVAEDPFARELLLREMERDWQALHRRFGHFAEFAAMVGRDVPEANAA